MHSYITLKKEKEATKNKIKKSTRSPQEKKKITTSQLFSHEMIAARCVSHSINRKFKVYQWLKNRGMLKINDFLIILVLCVTNHISE